MFRNNSRHMKEKLNNITFSLLLLMIVILLFTIFDNSIHGLQDIWSVPEYYFKDKIPFGFLWGIVGLIFARKVHNTYLKALTVSGIISVTLQTRYFLEGYPLSFVFLFLLFHFIILYFLSLGMFLILKKYAK